jgi:hypothetical protein
VLPLQTFVLKTLFAGQDKHVVNVVAPCFREYVPEAQLVHVGGVCVTDFIKSTCRGVCVTDFRPRLLYQSALLNLWSQVMNLSSQVYEQPLT